MGFSEPMQTIQVNGKVRFYLNSAGNDLWIRECVFPGKLGGYFVEAGAADGISGSSCYLLERKLGWSGICVEPHETFFRKLSRMRPDSIKEFACLSSQSGTVSFLEGERNSPDAYHSGVKVHLKRFKGESERILHHGSEVARQALTLEELLRKHNAPAFIDYAAFDMEGSEFEVLKDFPFSRYRFGAISMECDGKIWDAITELMTGNGYREVKNPFNVDEPWERYWLHESTPDPQIPEITLGPGRRQVS